MFLIQILASHLVCEQNLSQLRPHKKSAVGQWTMNMKNRDCLPGVLTVFDPDPDLQKSYIWSPTKTAEKDKVWWLKWENETKTPHQLWLSVSDSSFDFVVMKPISQSWPSQSQSPYHRPGAKSWRPKVARIANAVRPGQNGHSCLQFSRCI